MALCINQSGTYRNITTLCINNSGIYRELVTGRINQAGTYRTFTSGFTVPIPLGSCYCGGFLICKAAPLRYIVSPYSAEVSRNWYSRNDANTRSQAVSGCTGWFVPTKDQLQNPGYICRSFWGPSPCYSTSNYYWSSTQASHNHACDVYFNSGASSITPMGSVYCVRAFRCVTY